MQWHLGPFRLDLVNACLWQGDKRLALRPKTFDILVYLVEHAGELVTKDDLLSAIWPETVVAESVLTVSISELRKVLCETARAPRFVATVHRRGYRFIGPVTALDYPQTLPQSSESLDGDVSPSIHARGFPHPAPTMLVDRQIELEQLHQKLMAAQDGQRQVLFLTGEAGIGKTTLVDAFVHGVMQTQDVYVSRGQCLDQYGAGEAYLPLLEALGFLLSSIHGVELVTLLRHQAPSWLLQLPAFVPEVEFGRLQRRAGGATRERMLRELAELMETLTAERPLVLVLEDLHWSDASTLDWLAYVARRRQPAQLLILGTYRPVDAAVRDHRVRTVAHELNLHGHGTELKLDYLSKAGVAAYLRQSLELTTLPEALVERLYQRTNGNPLFLRLMVDEMVRQDILVKNSANWTFHKASEALQIEIPNSIQHLIEHQLGALSVEDQQLLETASVAGAEFSAATVAAGMDESVEVVEVRCAALARHDHFIRSQGHDIWTDGTIAARYGFIHDLYREALYARIPAGRSAQLHQRIGFRLEAGYGRRAEEIAAELAEHFVRGHDLWRAVTYLRQAGWNALQRSAHQEIIPLLNRALDVLETLPWTKAKAEHELQIQLMLGVALCVTRGYTAWEMGLAYKKAWALGQQIPDAPQLAPVLDGLWRYHAARGELRRARELGEQCLSFAQSRDDASLLLIAHMALGITLFYLGEITSSRWHCEQGMAVYDRTSHHHWTFLVPHDPGVACYAFMAQALWLLGYPDRALAKSQAGLSVAQGIASPFSVAYALNLVAVLHQLRREGRAAYQRAQDVIAFSIEQGFPQMVAMGTILQGWALATQGQEEEGMAQIRQGLETSCAGGSCLGLPPVLGQLAEIHLQSGQAEAGLDMVEEALTIAAQTGEVWYEGELYRLRGECLLAQSGTRHILNAAEESFLKAFDIARRQQARSWQLRAAISLCRLWQRQNKQKEAHDLLISVYNRYTEGFDTSDLQEAKMLIDPSKKNL